MLLIEKAPPRSIPQLRHSRMTRFDMQIISAIFQGEMIIARFAKIVGRNILTTVRLDPAVFCACGLSLSPDAPLSGAVG
jgi:hypothetical protein